MQRDAQRYTLNEMRIRSQYLLSTDFKPLLCCLCLHLALPLLFANFGR